MLDFFRIKKPLICGFHKHPRVSLTVLLGGEGFFRGLMLPKELSLVIASSPLGEIKGRAFDLASTLPTQTFVAKARPLHVLVARGLLANQLLHSAHY